MSETFTVDLHGFTGYGLRSKRVALIVVPALGAKLASLRDLHSGREWMWSPPDGGAWRRLPTGAPFPESSLVGADECIPTIAPCVWRGRSLPDHGEVWTEEWEIDAAAFAAGAVETRLQMPITPGRLTRRITLDDTTVHLRYALQNLSAEPCEFVWAFHPLMTIHEGDELILPDEVRRIRINAAHDTPLGGLGSAHAWPSPRPEMDLRHLDLGQRQGAPGRALKFFTEPLRTGYAAIRNRQSGDAIHFAWDVEIVRLAGIWINRGGWNGYHHVAIEPTTGAPDALDVAVREWQEYASVPPHGMLEWGFTMTLDGER
jgi:galactose mutarotase-like enzyme